MQDNQSTFLFGKRFRNRLFVGGLPLNTTAQELAEFFSNFSQVIEAKVIVDENQIPKGYGFVTFSNEGDVYNVTNMGTLFLRNKKLNLGPAVKKQAPTPVENSELVVVSRECMRGEYYYPVPVQQLPYQYPQQQQGLTYNCLSYTVPVPGYATMAEWEQLPVQNNATVPANIITQTGFPVRYPSRRRPFTAPRFRRMQRDTV